ncbi:MAG: DUF5106 domain-containing protein [Phycisphaerales bacterium]|nr:DUF5106 domain-containing protein [Phycisphaerales bacterium]
MRIKLITVILIIATNLIYTSAVLAQKKAYSSNKETGIKITILPLKNKWVYVGSYFGKVQTLVDSVWLNDQSEGVLHHTDSLSEGIYFIYTVPGIFDFLIGKNKSFAIEADTANQFAYKKFKNSEENTEFDAYERGINGYIKTMNSLKQQLDAEKNTSTAIALKDSLITFEHKVGVYRDDYIQKHPRTLLAALLTCARIPYITTPSITKKDGTIDTIANFYYIKSHYWDGVDLSNPIFLYTPFFDSKLTNYLDNYIEPIPDSLYKFIKHILLLTRTNPAVHHYLLGKFTDMYIQPKIMGEDKVFLDIFNDYYAQGDTNWLTPKQRTQIFNTAYSIMANQIGDVAPNLNLTDSNGVVVPLFSIDAPYIIVCIWDHNCSHCQETMPLLDSFFVNKWEKLGVKIYSVDASATKEPLQWKDFIKKYNLTQPGWIHVCQTPEQEEVEKDKKLPNYRQYYDAFVTPAIFLLDSSKRIIAKKIPIDIFDRFISKPQ